MKIDQQPFQTCSVSRFTAAAERRCASGGKPSQRCLRHDRTENRKRAVRTPLTASRPSALAAHISGSQRTLDCAEFNVGRIEGDDAIFISYSYSEADTSKTLPSKVIVHTIGYFHPPLPQSSSASRATAGAAGFLNFSQSFERPDR
jgi:hypothetical protein